MSEVQIFDGDGSNPWPLAEVMSRFVQCLKKTNQGHDEIRTHMRELLALGCLKIKWNQQSSVTLPTGEVLEFPPNVLGPPPGEWFSGTDLPQFFGYYWIKTEERCLPILADFGTKGLFVVTDSSNGASIGDTIVSVAYWKHGWPPSKD